MLKTNDLSFAGQKVVVSGSGNVSTYAMEKAIELGATVIACSDSSGYIYDENGIDVDIVKEIKEVQGERINTYLKYVDTAKYVEGCEKIWSLSCDIALPCATQNELDEKAARQLIANDVIAVAEGANMPCTKDAIERFQENGILFAPAKAANAGGVAVSSMEMAQNSQRVSWSAEEVDEKLQEVMKEIYRSCLEAAEEYGNPGDLIMGANIAGFLKVANAMVIHGIR